MWPVVEKSIAFSVIVPIMHGVIILGLVARRFFASESLESCQERAKSRDLGEDRLPTSLSLSFFLTPSLLPRSSLELFLSVIVDELIANEIDRDARERTTEELAGAERRAR